MQKCVVCKGDAFAMQGVPFCGLHCAAAWLMLLETRVSKLEALLEWLTLLETRVDKLEALLEKFEGQYTDRERRERLEKGKAIREAVFRGKP